MTHISITSIDDDFIGIGYLNNQKVFVKNTIIGDIVDTNSKEVISTSIDRIKPECIHYDYCGGCSLQYIKEEKYLEYKNQILINIVLSLKQNVNIVSNPITVGKYKRRRASFKIENNKIGYYAEKTHKIFDLKECFILESKITDIIPIFRNFLKLEKMNFTKIDVTLSDNGLDLILYKNEKFQDTEIQAISKFANNNKISRISSNINNRIESMICLNQPFIKLGELNVLISESSFLQASKVSEQVLIDLVVKNIKDSKNILDLYSGIGTYSFPLEKYYKITAIDSSSDMIKNSNLAYKNNIKFICRNLHNQPLTQTELKKFDAVIINPPREGAIRQISHLAVSKIKKIIMISCNHKTFKRDAKILIDAGYKISQAQMIDQFYYSKHIEIFSYFTK